MKNRFEEFFDLHQQAEPLLIGNVWNVQSAKIFEQKQFKAIATSSQAVADTLGYADGEGMSFEEYLFIIKRIAASASIPFSVDLEGGYGDTPEQVCANILQLSAAGVAGINIEDSVMIDGKRTILPADIFAGKMKSIVSQLNSTNTRMFINVRCDSFLLGLPNAPEDALARVDAYKSTGVHGLFFPCITDIGEIETLTANSQLPVSVMCMPNLPGFDELQKAGVKRISMGGFLNHDIYQKLGASIENIVVQGSFKSLF